MLNAFRGEQGMAHVSASRKLERVAEKHGADMARNGFFSHQGSDGSSISDRALRGGYRYCVIAENIAKGQRSLQQVMREWVNSPGHRRNMLLKRVSEAAVTRGPGDIWVMVLGHAGC
ncbi:MAG: serine protease [Rhodobacterales bacterium]|nr:MAG: serine protease [Rhodobacterales bacterium]